MQSPQDPNIIISIFMKVDPSVHSIDIHVKDPPDSSIHIHIRRPLKPL